MRQEFNWDSNDSRELIAGSQTHVGTSCEGSYGFNENGKFIRHLQRMRALRSSYFPGAAFSDPAWDVLLEVGACHFERRRVAMSDVAFVTGIPSTTCLRWISTLVQKNILAREDDPIDRRRAFLSLTSHSEKKLSDYIGAVSMNYSALV